MQFLPGGMTRYGVADLEKEFNIKFAGRGFYFTKTGVILVLPCSPNVELSVENESQASSVFDEAQVYVCRMSETVLAPLGPLLPRDER